MLDPAKWVDDYGDYLFRYALSRLRDREAAEEMLQETLVAGLKARDQYSGKRHQRAWLLGILKRKVIDFVRKRSRMKPESDFEEDIETLLFSPT
jgi:RNA polymerase sigma-70 factor (ECF subfamily)